MGRPLRAPGVKLVNFKLSAVERAGAMELVQLRRASGDHRYNFSQLIRDLLARAVKVSGIRIAPAIDPRQLALLPDVANISAQAPTAPLPVQNAAMGQAKKSRVRAHLARTAPDSEKRRVTQEKRARAS